MAERIPYMLKYPPNYVPRSLQTSSTQKIAATTAAEVSQQLSDDLIRVSSELSTEDDGTFSANFAVLVSLRVDGNTETQFFAPPTANVFAVVAEQCRQLGLAGEDTVVDDILFGGESVHRDVMFEELGMGEGARLFATTAHTGIQSAQRPFVHNSTARYVHASDTIFAVQRAATAANTDTARVLPGWLEAPHGTDTSAPSNQG